MQVRRARALPFITFLPVILAIFLVGAQPAQAHTSVVTTNPIYKSTLAEMPSDISITFTEPLMLLGEKKVNSISLTSPSGKTLDLAVVIKEGNILIANLPAVEYLEGTYLISYRVVSEDGHPVSGSYELYLNHPSSKSVSTSAADENENHHGFFHIHQVHLVEAGVGAILLVLWWGYRRFNADQGE